MCVPARLSAVHVTILHYSLCDSKAVCSSCHRTALQSVCQQVCLQFMSPYCITVCVPTRLSAVHVTILHYSVCASKVACSSCHHIALQYVCTDKAVCSSCHHIALQCVCVCVCVCQQGCLQFMSPYCITVCVPARMSAVHVIKLHYSVCNNKAVCKSCHHTALECVCQQGCLRFMSTYCITVCVPARLSAVHVTIMHYSVYATKAVCSSCHHIALQYMCANKDVCGSCHHSALQYVYQQECLQLMSPYALQSVCQQSRLQFMSPYLITVCVPARLSAVNATALQCVCKQGCLQFMSPYCITKYVPTRQSADHVTILHYIVFASKAVCRSCHHIELHSMCQQGCLQIMSPYCITVCVPTRLSAVHVTILHYSVCVPSRLSAVHVTLLHYNVCVNKAVCSSCHRTALQCVCRQQGCLHFMSPYCITVCVSARMSAVHVTVLHYSLCASKAVCNSCHHTAFQCLCQEGSLQFMSSYCFTVCVPARLSSVHVTIMHYSLCANKAVCRSCHHTALHLLCQQGCLQFMLP